MNNLALKEMIKILLVDFQDIELYTNIKKKKKKNVRN